MNKILINKQFKAELLVAVIIAGLACCAALSNYLFVSNDYYPLTSDAMGHMAKVKYITDCLLRGEFPAWFPYWYNGATVWQYYPPLSYLLMVPVQMMTDNVMLTFKINCFIILFVGSMGVWFFCRLYVGRWCGLFGVIIYCLQPFILISLFRQGVLAQGPIFAVTPWLFAVILSFGKDLSSKKFVGIILLTAMMILSHAMHAFMIIFCIMCVFILFVILKKVTLKSFMLLFSAMLFAGIITAFWSFVGTTKFENPDIPYMLQESIMNFTATIDSFINIKNNIQICFGVPVSICSFLTIILYAYLASLKKTSQKDNYYIPFCIILTLFTIVFSFGLYLPFFKYIPLAESLLPGRILSLTSVAAAILCAYFLSAIYLLTQDKKMFTKILAVFVCLAIVFGMLVSLNPYKEEYQFVNDGYKFKQMFSDLNASQQNFEKGRYYWLYATKSQESFFPYIYNYNSCGGWNIEGTQHNQTLWNHNVATTTKNVSYISKDLAFWNVRVLATDIGDKEDINTLNILNKKYNFRKKGERGNYEFYESTDTSSYFLTDNRNALVLGPGSPGIAITFPYLVKGKSNDISDYTLKELEKYKLIYLCEPSVNTEKEQENIEKIVMDLVNKGITVIIEPAVSKNFPLFDVNTEDIDFEEMPIIEKQENIPINTDITNIPTDKKVNFTRVLFGLDESYYALSQNDGTLMNDIIGTKKVGNGKVIFIGGHLSQYLKAVYVLNWGVPKNDKYPECEKNIKSLYEDIFKTYDINTNFWPDAFPVEKSQWNYKGGNFSYVSENPKEVTVSITYTPRWKAFVDGSLITVKQRENLIVLDLPAGKHSVVLNYGITKYGIMGYAISCAGIVLLLLFLRYYDKIIHLFDISGIYIRKYLQL